MSGTRGLQSQSLYAYYGGGQFGAFSLSLDFVAGLHDSISPPQNYAPMSKALREAMGVENARKELFLDLEKKIRWCQALCFPKPKNPPSKKDAYYVSQGQPPRVLITIGEFLTLLGVVQSCNISWNGPWDPIRARPSTANVQLQIERLNYAYPDWYDIRSMVRFENTTIVAAENGILTITTGGEQITASSLAKTSTATIPKPPAVPEIIPVGKITPVPLNSQNQNLIQ
jgi:hypothetical protein